MNQYSFVNMTFTVRKMFYYNRYVNLNVKCQTIREHDILRSYDTRHEDITEFFDSY